MAEEKSEEKSEEKLKEQQALDDINKLNQDVMAGRNKLLNDVLLTGGEVLVPSDLQKKNTVLGERIAAHNNEYGTTLKRPEYMKPVSAGPAARGGGRSGKRTVKRTRNRRGRSARKSKVYKRRGTRRKTKRRKKSRNTN